MKNCMNRCFVGSFGFLALCLINVPHASAQQITGRYYPEKTDYLVGEPIVVIFEVENAGSATVQIGESSCSELNTGQFVVDHATPKRKFALFGCAGGTGGSCGGTIRNIPPGGKYQQRLLLEGNFELDSLGTYHIRAKRDQRITLKGVTESVSNLNVDSDFTVVLRSPTEDNLEKAYQPFIDDLHSRDFGTRLFAVRVVTQNPPPFAEPAILDLADDPAMRYTSVDGLKRLGTPAARTELLQMSSLDFPESLRQQAIPALGEIGNSEDCLAMLDIAAKNKDYTQIEAYVAAGSICKEQVVSILANLLPTANPPLLGGLAIALKNTSSRQAIPLLIDLLQYPDQSVRSAATDALSLLTHHKSKYPVEELDQAMQAYSQWSNWWRDSGATAPLFDPNQCVLSQLLP